MIDHKSNKRSLSQKLRSSHLVYSMSYLRYSRFRRHRSLIVMMRLTDWFERETDRLEIKVSSSLLLKLDALNIMSSSICSSSLMKAFRSRVVV